jgi:uncharacterized protein
VTGHDESPTAREIAETWFRAVFSGDVETALTLLHDDIEFVNYTPVPGYNTDMRWIGTHRGPAEVVRCFEVFLGTCEVRHECVRRLVVDGDEVMGVVHEISVVRETGREFEIEFIQHLTVRHGKIVRWKSYTDPSQIIRAIREPASRGT